MERIAPPETVKWGDSLQSTRTEWGESPHSDETTILPNKLFSFEEIHKCSGKDDFSGCGQHGKPVEKALAQKLHSIFLETQSELRPVPPVRAPTGGVRRLPRNRSVITYPGALKEVRLSRSPSGVPAWSLCLRVFTVSVV